MRGDALHVGVSCVTVDGGPSAPAPAPAVSPKPTVPANLSVGYHVKGYQFTWDPAVYADYYELAEDPDGAGPLPESPIGGPLASASYKHSLAPQLLHQRLNASYRVRACNIGGCSDWSAPLVPDLTQAIGYFKASNTGTGDYFGAALALSADGNTLAVGASSESSNATGIGGNQANNSAGNAGAVYVFIRSGSTWSQQAYVKASNTNGDDRFGYSLALSADGNTLAVGAVTEASNATGIGGNQANNSASNAGAVYVFIRSGSTWSQQAYVKASNTDEEDMFGHSLALSADGHTLAVGAIFEDSNATGVDGNQANNSASNAGAVYVFIRSGSTWSQQAYVKASNTNAGDNFGASVALSADGGTLTVGAAYEQSNATGVGGNQADNSAFGAGAVYVFTRSGGTWNQQAYVKASNTGPGAEFGYSLALSADGNTMTVGARGERSKATGIGGNQADNSAFGAGAVYVFTRSGSTWSQQAYVKASNTGMDDIFGPGLALTSDGRTMAVGAYQEDSKSAGIGGDQADNSAPLSGAVYLY
ncbi:integrin [Comamonas flocculans]|uniref:Integrin n=2 Tax=Comamonas flocculans TaxID=2597701 RepID=A0A5B8RYA1_9BURK|nr:integrin [Comamonas flocculans]